MTRTLLALTALLAVVVTARAESPPAASLGDKTFVAWVTLADLQQRGTGIITLENLPGQFDSMVLGEIVPQKWMAGSDFFRRTQKGQADLASESADSSTLVQIGIAYQGREVTLSRDGKLYARYTMDNPPVTFGPKSVVLLGLRLYELTGPTFRGSIADVRVYDRALDLATIARLTPDRETPDAPRPVAWWDFEEGSLRDRAGMFPTGHLEGAARVEKGRLILEGGYFLAGVDAPPKRSQESWPVYHITARESEGLARPYDANGCIYWKGKYHLMYIYQDRKRPSEGHSWGHVVSTDLVNWTFLPPALVPEKGDADVGTFSGNAFLDKDGVPNLCWFGIDAGVCIASAVDDDLVRWKKHPRNPIIPMPKPGQPGHGQYRVWDPYLWREGDQYLCLLGGNTLPNGKDTLDAWTSPDLVNWTRKGPFYQHPDLSWTTPGEDCSCPDFFKLGDQHALLCISHKVGARIYLGEFDADTVTFKPRKHVRMNWPGGHFFAPESLVDDRGRRIIWAWVTDPRTINTQRSTGSGVQSLPRVIGIDADGNLTINPPEEIDSLRRKPRSFGPLSVGTGKDLVIDGLSGQALEIDLDAFVENSTAVGLKVRRAADGAEETTIWYEPATKMIAIDMSKSTSRGDVVYTEGPLDTGGIFRAADYPHPRQRVEAPLELKPGEPLKLRVYLDGPMLEVFANGRQCVTQQIFPSRAESLGVALATRGGTALVKRLDAWEMAPARFVGR